MQKFFFALLFVSSTLLIQAQELNNNVFVSYARFLSPDQNYTELYITIDGLALTPTKSDVGFNTTALIELTAYNRNAVIYQNAYQLSSPPFKKKIDAAANLVDQKRIPTPDTTYTLIITITDAYDSTNKVAFSQKIDPLTSSTNDGFSDIVLVDQYHPTKTTNTFSKYGFDIIPYPFNFYPTEVDVLKFYAELYDPSYNGKVLFIDAYVSQNENEKILPQFRSMGRYQNNPITIILDEINIEQLPSGNYYLNLVVRNPQMETIARHKSFFQRLNENITLDNVLSLNQYSIDSTWVAGMTEDDINLYLASLIPISNQQEEKLILELKEAKNPELKKRFFYNFWFGRNADAAEKLWKVYKQQVDFTLENFSTTNTRGYATDRGRVHLQYGEPDDVKRGAFEPTAPPYEIWTYYSVNTGTRVQTNVQFVFLEEALATNNPELIHSNADGEIKDPKWKQQIYNGIIKPDAKNNLDRDDVPDNFGTEVDRDF